MKPHQGKAQNEEGVASPDEDESLFDNEGKTRTYEDFFTSNENSNLIVKMFDEHLGLENKTANNSTPEIVELDLEESSDAE